MPSCDGQKLVAGAYTNLMSRRSPAGDSLALARVEQSYQVQKEFTADAAHELRAPLAVLDARLQTLPESEERTALLTDARRKARAFAG